jgi:hypothetical protein
MYPISLPSFNVKLKEENQQTYIFDAIRKKYLVLTPEEWVRQHVIHLLINQYGYPKGLFKIEKGHKYNELQKRTDIMVYDKEGNVLLLVECKAHSEPINQTTLIQVMNYNMHYKASIVLITNGIKSFCFDVKDGATNQLKDIPKYN